MNAEMDFESRPRPSKATARRFAVIAHLLVATIRDLLYASALVLALPFLLYRGLKTGRYRNGLREKLLGLRPSDLRFVLRGNRVIWLHGVSVGEVQLLGPLAKRLRTEYPEHRIVVSVTTDSGMELASRILGDFDRFYFPLDFSWAIRRTLQTLKPDLIVLAELELWPNLSAAATLQEIPMVVVNGRLSQGSFRGYQRLGWLTRGMFANLAAVGAQTEEYAARFRQCGCFPSAVTTTGNLKFDNATFAADAPEVEQLRRLAGISASDRVLILGSSQSEEETAVLAAYPDLARRHENLRLIVVPRHPERFDDVFARCLESAHGLRVKRRSEFSSEGNHEAWDILLVDSVGELRWWWGLAEIALVGGSFGSRGGQNMIEPAAYGANVAFGPNTSNFRDVSQLLLDANACERLSGVDAIGPWVGKQILAPEQGKRRGEAAIAVIASQQGATERTLEMLAHYLLPNAGAKPGASDAELVPSKTWAA